MEKIIFILELIEKHLGAIIGGIVGALTIYTNIAGIKEKRRKKDALPVTEFIEINPPKISPKKDFRSKRKPLFFIYELLLNDLSTDKNHYLLKGRLVSKDNVDFESMNLEFSHDGKWEGEPKYYRFEKQVNIWNKIDDGISLDIIDDNSKNKNKLVGNSKDGNGLNIGNDSSYDIEANYVVIKKDSAYAYKSLKDDSYKSLNISLSGVGDEKRKIENVKIIKCPNIRKGWLIFYFLFSLLALFICVLSAVVSINKYWEYMLNADITTKSVLIIYGILILSVILLFIQMIVKCVSQYIILIKMKKLDIPRKTKIVSDTLLIPKIIEYMTGSEKVDNIFLVHDNFL